MRKGVMNFLSCDLKFFPYFCRAKLNKTEVVYVRESDCNKTGFVEGFSENINESTTKSRKNGKGDEAVSFTNTSNKSEEGGTFIKFDDNFAG